ncbi:LysM peptidoglycan-binding domain-containing protein [Flavobacterium sp.]|uniref:LysM peptidoglycan-binding domain-containing protein n=1 Tax=Flavobacterium sp. TaxID=239 RepID=UPI0039E61A67
MKKIVLLFVALVLFQTTWAQNKNQEVDIVSHTVQLGETVRMLSKKYLVDPTEIYRLNKFAVNGISQGMVLQIPVPRKEPVVQQEETVQEETPQEVVQNDPPPAEEPVKQKPKPAKAKPTPAKEQTLTVVSRDSETEHTVEAGETLYSLSRKYGISVDEIKMSNGDALKKGLKVGQIVRIPTTKSIDSTDSSIGSTVTPTKEVVEEKTVPTQVNETAPTETVSAGTFTHKVAPKETLYSLSKRYGVTVDDIKTQNPDVARHGLQIGQTLTITKN